MHSASTRFGVLIKKALFIRNILTYGMERTSESDDLSKHIKRKDYCEDLIFDDLREICM